MASGTISGTTNNKYITCRLQWTATKDSANNRSSLSVTLQLRKSTSSTAGTSGTGYFRLKYGSTTVNYTKSGVSIPADGVWRTVKTWNLGNISHNADGTKSLSLSLVNSGSYSGLPGTSYTDSYVSGTATFDKITPPSYTITASAGSNGSISPSGSVSVTHGSSKKFTFTPALGYKVGSVTVNGSSVGAPTSYTFSNVTKNHTISVSFVALAPTEWPVTVTTTGSGTVQAPATISNGDTATVHFQPDINWSVSKVLINGVSVGAPSSYTFSNVTKANTVAVTFIQTGGLPIPEVVVFEQDHTVAIVAGVVPMVRYHVQYDGDIVQNALLEVFLNGSLISSVQKSRPDVNYSLNGQPVEQGDVVTVRVTTDFSIKNDYWVIEVAEASDDNAWTYLGYADNQLVGLTKNEQVWNGQVTQGSLTNAKTVPRPANLSTLSITGHGSVSVSSTYHESNFPYRITLNYTHVNRFGPTLPAATARVFYANKPPLEWTTANYVKISGTAPNNCDVRAIELYYAEDEAQELAFLGRVPLAADFGANPTKSWSFNWTGYQMDTAAWLISNMTVPTQDYTKGAPASKMAVIDGQLYFWGNGAHPYRVWIGGNPGNRFSISPGTGGGFVDVDPGTGTVVKDVLKFKTQQGAAIVTVLTDNPNSSREARYNLVESKISISNEQSVKSWMAEKVAGAVGCKSEHGSVAAADGLYTVSRYGLAITTLTMEYNAQLQVTYVSDAIEPVFLKQYGTQLRASVLHEINGILYMTFGSPDEFLENVIFCYDIGLKAWWTYTLDINKPILNMINIDYEGRTEGLGIVTEDGVFLLPTTRSAELEVLPEHDVLIESGELSTVQPLQAMHHLSQLQLRFDYFIGDVIVTVKCLDQFGREIVTRKRISHDTVQHQLAESIRIDQVVESYQVIIQGQANFRLTHFNARLYPKPMRIGMVYGFDSSQGHNSSNSIRRTFSSYNDLRKAIIP